MLRGVAATMACLLLGTAAAIAQFGFARGPFHEYPNIPYDGRFTFVRLKYTTAPGGYWYGGWPAWGHGYPIAYVIEVDWWAMTDSEAVALRTYMQKGGFVIIDDFKPRRFRGGFGGG